MKFSDKIRNKVYNKFGGKCAYCGCELHITEEEDCDETEGGEK